jgi:hypothetical protein
MVEGLGRSLKVTIHSHQLQDLNLHASHIPISDNQFVDDTMLMRILTTREAKYFKTILDDFMEAFGTFINHIKHQIFFLNTPLVFQFHVSHIPSYSQISPPSKYLRSPLLYSTIHNATWEYLLSKLNKNIYIYTFRTLDIVFHLILLKFVLRAIPIYLFSTLVAPKFIIKSIKTI